MSKDQIPLYIKSVDELKQFPIGAIDQELPWNYRATACCFGIVARPVFFVLGQGRLLKKLHEGQKEELKIIISTMKDETEWERLNAAEKLDFRIRGTNLTDQYSVDRVTSGRK